MTGRKSDARRHFVRRARPQRLGRRCFLRGALAGGATVAVGLPLLDLMVDGNGTALADGSPLPMRFGTFYWGCGILHRDWVPDQHGPGWTLPPSLEPFADLSPELPAYLTLVTGTNHRESSPGHIPARGITLSSSHNPRFVAADEGAGYRDQAMPEPSIDVIVREAWAGQAALHDSVHLAITEAAPYHGNSSWERGGTALNVPETSPSSLFQHLFSGIAGPATPEEPSEHESALLRVSTALERSMLDALLEDARSLRSRLGTRDRIRLEDHLDGLRSLEVRLQEYERRLTDPTATPDPASCEATMREATGETMREKSELMSDLLAVALACDLTRVFSYEWSANQSEFVYGELGIGGTHHDDISHYLGARADDQGRIVRLIMTGYGHLAERLRARPELDGNVLDNTLILGTSEHANANAHDYRDHPFLMVGKAGGRIRAGQHFRHPSPFDNAAAPDVLLTAVRAVGVEVDGLGMAETQDSRGTTLPNRRTTQTISEIEG